MSAMNTLKKFGLEQAFNYVYKDPDKNFIKIMDWADKFSGGGFPTQRAMIRAAISNPEHPYYPFIHRLVTDIDPHVMKTLVANFFINANLAGWKKQDECREKYGCNIPWAILLDPTSACNLHCTGCWAAEYGNKLNLTYDEIDDIIRQGKELGVYMYIYTGGEPLVRKKDLIRLCEKHNDCIFLSFTNATLIDEDFANDMLRVGTLFLQFHWKDLRLQQMAEEEMVYTRRLSRPSIFSERRSLYLVSLHVIRVQISSLSHQRHFTTA